MSLIAIDARESGTSTGRYIDKLIEYLAKIDPDYDINIITKPHRVDFMHKIAPKFYVHESDVKEFTFAEQLALLKQIKGVDADLVHFGMTQQPILYKGKRVTTIHDLTTVRFRNPAKNPVVFKTKQFVYKWVIRIAADKSELVITPTEYVKKDLMNFTGQPARKFTVTYESADKIKEKVDPYKGLVGKKFLMYVGRPTPHKNLERLIKAYEILKIKYPNLNLVLAGKKDFNYEQVEKSVNERGIKDVVFTDFVSEGEMRWLYENCAAYVLPSLSEGFGLTGVEAMVNGAPLVSSNATCMPEVYGNAARYFDPLDIEDMANAIGKVIASPKIRKELIKRGHDQAAKYSWQKMAEQTLDVYKKVLGS